MRELLFIPLLYLTSTSLSSQSMFVVHQEITANEATLPRGVFSTNSLGLHIEDSLAVILKNLYALNGEPIGHEQISLKHNPLVRLQVVSRQTKPILYYIDKGIKKLLQDYSLYEKTVEDTLIDTIVITSIEENHSGKRILESGSSEKGIVFDNTSLSTICWKMSNNGIRIKVSNKLLLKERLTIYMINKGIPSVFSIEEVLRTMRKAGVVCTIQQLPVQKIID